ncbi:MAG: hypothetical protein ACRDSH_00230, partial [Pseudonocardiaceae bacterium]
AGTERLEQGPQLVIDAGFVDARAARLERIEQVLTGLADDADPDRSEHYTVWARKPPISPAGRETGCGAR